jgi:hypothetical protein
VGGRDERGTDVQPVERVDIDPVLIHGDRHGSQPGRRNRLAVEAEARILDGHGLGTPRPQRTAHEHERLRKPGCDEHPFRPADHTADAAQVAR